MNNEFEALRARVASLKSDLDGQTGLLQSEIEIQNLMGCYVFTYRGTKYNRCLAMFSAREDVSVEIVGVALFQGRERVNDYYLKYCPSMDGNRIDVMHEHYISTPLIRLSADGSSARGLWISDGEETYPVNGKPKGAWVWGRYDVDFIREDGQWKILHLRFFPTFEADFHQSWTEGVPEWLYALKQEKLAAVEWEKSESRSIDLSRYFEIGRECN